MSIDADRLYELLPGAIRYRDTEQGYPLRDLMRVIGEQADLLDDDIRRLYDDLFIETCEQWVVPYIGDLVGYRPLTIPGNDGDDCTDANRNRLLVPRRAVADTLALRRRKGTWSVLEELAEAVTGWHVAVRDDEGAANEVPIHIWRLQAWPLTRIRPFHLPRRTNSYAFSVLGNDAPLFARGELHQDIGQPTALRDIPEPITVAMLEDARDRYYGEGKSICLYENNHPIAIERLVPMDLTTWEPEVFEDKVAVDPERGRFMLPERYRTRRITASYHYGFASAIGGGEYRRTPATRVVGSYLFRTGHLPGQGLPLAEVLQNDDAPFTVYVRGLFDEGILDGDASDPNVFERRLDTELNRILQAFDLTEGPIELLELEDETMRLVNLAPQGPRRIQLNRLLLEEALPDVIRRAYALIRVVSEPDRQVIMAAVRTLQESERPPIHMVVEIADSGLYVEPVVIDLPAHHTLELRAAEGCRPTIVLPERSADNDDMLITCGAASRIILDGLMVSRHAVRIVGNPTEVIVRHCTLVPGWELDEHCEPCCGEEPSLVLSDIHVSDNVDREGEGGEADRPLPTHLRVDRSIVGTILIQRDEVGAEAVHLDVCRSIVDATSETEEAIVAPANRHAHAILNVVSSTVIGIIRTHAIELGENSIFLGEVQVARRQIGCLRYSYVPFASRTPRRHACQPDLVMQAANEEAPGSEANRVVPIFRDPDLRYGRPEYCRLSDACAVEIRTGADDEAEMGVYHDLYQPQRMGNLTTHLAEYLPLGWQSRPIYEN